MTVRLVVPLLLESGALVDLTRAPVRSTGTYDFVPYLAGTAAIVIVVAGYFTWRHRRRRDDEPAVGTALNSEGGRFDPAEKEELERTLMQGDYEAAAELLEQAGRHEEAAEYFARTDAYERAAECYKAAGNLVQATYFFKQSGQRRRAGKLYAEQEDYRSAAAEFVEAGEPRLAATYYEKGGDPLRAAERYASVGERRRAARNYEEADQPERAAREYERLFEHALEESEEELSASAARYAELAGRCYAEAGAYAESGEIYRRAGRRETAAQMFAKSGESSEAADLLMEAGEVETAVSLLEDAGENRRAYRAKGEMAYESGQFQEAAAAFEKSGDHRKAAKLYDEVLEGPERAAELYEKGGAWLEAADAYERVERYADAAHCAEEGGEMAKAAELYRKAGETDAEIRVRKLQGDYFRAGHLLYEHHQFDEALETLQRINPRDPIHSKGLELQGDVYRAMDRPEEAYGRYRAALGSRDAGEPSLPLHYKMGRVMEAVENWKRAAEHYDNVLEIESSYEDAESRRRALAEGVRPGGNLEGPVEGGAESHRGVRGGAGEGGFAQAGSVDQEGEVRYEIVDEVARGGMGVVYRARDTFLNRIVAVKVLGEDLRDNETAVKYFLREARAAAALAHPNIVTIFDAGEQRGEYYIAMEYVDGETLKEKIERGERLSEEQLRYVLVEACKALDYAHGEEVLHRDVKSDNIMYKADDSVKVMDFGLAKFLQEYQQNHTQQIGTPYYMSPEQIIGEAIDFRADLYGLGCTAFECITGRVPFTEGELAYHHVHTEPPRPSEFTSEISDDMEEIILKLLEKDPEDRFESARALLNVLQR